MDAEEKILIELLKESSSKAFDTIYNRYSGKLYNFILKISNNNAYMAEEIVQRVFIKLWEIRQEIDPEKSFNSFITTIARNMLMNEFNHETVRFIYQNHILLSQSSSSTFTEEKIEYTFLKQYIETLINKLPPACKEVYRLSRMESFTNREIATHLNKSESTVEKQLAKANKFIAEKVKLHYDKIFIGLVVLQFF